MRIFQFPFYTHIKIFHFCKTHLYTLNYCKLIFYIFYKFSQCVILFFKHYKREMPHLSGAQFERFCIVLWKAMASFEDSLMAAETIGIFAQYSADLCFNSIQLQSQLPWHMRVIGSQHGFPHWIELAQNSRVDLLQGLQCVHKMQIHHIG